MGQSVGRRGLSAIALYRARVSAFGEGEYVGQESFVTATEILALARAAGVGPGRSVLDLCCGIGAAALYVAERTGCRLTGVDLSAEAVELATLQAESRGLAGRARFRVGDATDVRLGTQFDAVLLLETMLAIEDKPALLHEVARLLRPGGRVALTLEEGRPLAPEERRRMPEGESVWLLREDEFLSLLDASGFRALQVEDHTSSHAQTAHRLTLAYEADRERIAAAMGEQACEEILSAHGLWVEWMSTGRVRKLAVVAERV